MCLMLQPKHNFIKMHFHESNADRLLSGFTVALIHFNGISSVFLVESVMFKPISLVEILQWILSCANWKENILSHFSLEFNFVFIFLRCRRRRCLACTWNSRNWMNKSTKGWALWNDFIWFFVIQNEILMQRNVIFAHTTDMHRRSIEKCRNRRMLSYVWHSWRGNSCRMLPVNDWK